MKTTRRQGVDDAKANETTRLNIRISKASYQRLMITSVMNAKAPGALVETLIEEHLRQWRVQGNPITRGKIVDRHENAPEINLDAPPPPCADAA